jgi:hypothetical protein
MGQLSKKNGHIKAFPASNSDRTNTPDAGGHDAAWSWSNKGKHSS